MDPRCEYCGIKIPKRRVENARRVGRKAKYHSDGCHSAAKQQRYRYQLPKFEYGNMQLRNLVAHSMIAERVLRDPTILAIVKAYIEQREMDYGIVQETREWKDLIDSGDHMAVVTALIRVDQVGVDMRLFSPFGPLLTYEDRSLIFESNTGIIKPKHRT